ncbi:MULTISPECIES: ABC transporter permease [Nonomuraea]|uniref:ABC transporter permease n=1 Tax=Nonomuraea ferruginea TaxID=46174 RepID=A0ABT4T3F3_9ACTN|nr:MULTISPECIES: ABC transporter permease [Nonomuraea]MDA0643845.1 ABC transporter permease [Nonomuraea ferruginea]TXK38917.1 ABC transporter permease [Nonomuraea sp. C10]
MFALLRLTVRRLVILPPMLLGVTLLVFVVLQFSPNDPAYNALGDGASPEARAAYRAEHGLDDPLPLRYVRFLGQLAQGDLGYTAPPATPVIDRVVTAFPLTIQLTVLGLVLAVAGALAFGVTGALHRDRWPDQVTRVLSIAGVAMPSFWLGILLIQEFALGVPIFPTGGYVNPADSVTGWLLSLALPSIAIAVPAAASLSRLVRTSMVEELDKDYVRTATGNGLPRAIVVRGALRNALITPLTVLGLRVGYLLSGAVVIETIFDLPGMGKLILEGVTNGDVALVQGAVLTIAVAFLLVNLVVDLLYLLVNPRIRAV